MQNCVDGKIMFSSSWNCFLEKLDTLPFHTSKTGAGNRGGHRNPMDIKKFNLSESVQVHCTSTTPPHILGIRVSNPSLQKIETEFMKDIQ